MKAKIAIGGMHCGSCALNIDEALEELDGVEKASTSFARGRSKVVFDEREVDLETIAAAIAELGYEARPA